jgi:hypothetical protein
MDDNSWIAIGIAGTIIGFGGALYQAGMWHKYYSERNRVVSANERLNPSNSSDVREYNRNAKKANDLASKANERVFWTIGLSVAGIVSGYVLRDSYREKRNRDMRAKQKTKTAPYFRR